MGSARRGCGRPGRPAAPDRRVSGFHARIERDASGRFVLTDSGSTNGSRLNGQPITTAELHDGDVIQLGGSSLRYEQGV